MDSTQKELLRSSNKFRFVGMGFGLFCIVAALVTMLFDTEPVKIARSGGDNYSIPFWMILMVFGLLGSFIAFWPQIKEILGVQSLRDILPWGKTPPVIVQGIPDAPPVPQVTPGPPKKKSGRGRSRRR